MCLRRVSQDDEDDEATCCGQTDRQTMKRLISGDKQCVLGVWQQMKAEETCRTDNTQRGKASLSLSALVCLSRTKRAAESRAVCSPAARAVSSRYQAAELGAEGADGKWEEVRVELLKSSNSVQLTES